MDTISISNVGKSWETVSVHTFTVWTRKSHSFNLGLSVRYPSQIRRHDHDVPGSTGTLPAPSAVFIFPWRDFQDVQKFHFFRSRRQMTVGNCRRRNATASCPYVVRGLKRVIVYHGTHRTYYGYAAVEYFLEELWRYSHNSYSSFIIRSLYKNLY